MIPNVLSIATVDPSGGAGVLADIKTFTALGAYGCGVIAALTSQNTQQVSGIHVPPVSFLRLQMDTLMADVAIHAGKTGMLANAQVVREVTDCLERYRIPRMVCDPVMVAKSGDRLLERDAVNAVREALFPQMFMVTPNLPEAAALLEESPVESAKAMHRVAEKIRMLLPLSSQRWVLLKGGHLPGNEVMDLLFDGDRMIELPAQRIETRHTHGTGCTLSSAIAALLPQYPDDRDGVTGAVQQARHYLLEAIRHSVELRVGHGHGPVHHFHGFVRTGAE